MLRGNGHMNSTNNCPRLIKVALPIREISAESVRDKSLSVVYHCLHFLCYYWGYDGFS
jgi:hypothetical protein